ncbi:hypothetical protein N9W21_02755 [Shewanella sp.]|nr:hypothetical protein [Shewanella sp.]
MLASKVNHPRPHTHTLALLLIFLLSTAVVALSLLYVELASNNQTLQVQVDKLTAEQVLLVVPDQQAEAIAHWMQSNPQWLAHQVLQARKHHSSISTTIGPTVDSAKAPQPLSANEPSTEPLKQAHEITMTAEGVRIISLPHGGIRITTRELENNNKH